MATDRTSDRTAKRKRFGWDRPRYRDRAFLAAVAITVVLVVLQGLLLTDRGSAFWYLNLAVRVVITWIIISAVIRIRVGIQRGLVRGYAESQQQAADRPEGKADSLAKASGRTVGRAIASYKKVQQKPPS